MTPSPYVPADEDGFVALFQDPRVSRWMGDGPQDVYAANRFDVWAVRHAGRYAGHAEIKSSPEPWPDGHELVHAPAPAGRGPAVALTAYGHDTLGPGEVHATVDAGNAPSLSLLTRLGYTHVRDIPENSRGGGTSRLTHRRR
ncbi:GNAT family N-acetyltransferase [Streptomyces sp. NPDC058595]|uniref:GNAT family N-acetyltransferase n=1 Tax=Streptomyces sp. NPDC058595 TaxID=3346550 RepID=UPI003655AF55